MGGGSRWLWLTRPLIWNTAGDYEFTLIVAAAGVVLVMVAIIRLFDWLF
jgi:hypothetical protein